MEFKAKPQTWNNLPGCRCRERSTWMSRGSPCSPLGMEREGYSVTCELKHQIQISRHFPGIFPPQFSQIEKLLRKHTCHVFLILHLVSWEKKKVNLYSRFIKCFLNWSRCTKCDIRSCIRQVCFLSDSTWTMWMNLTRKCSKLGNSINRLGQICKLAVNFSVISKSFAKTFPLAVDALRGCFICFLSQSWNSELRNTHVMFDVKHMFKSLGMSSFGINQVQFLNSRRLTIVQYNLYMRVKLPKN